MDSDDLKDSLLNLLSLLKDIKNVEIVDNSEKESIKDIIEQIRSILWINSDKLSKNVPKELEEALNGLIEHYPQEISEKENFMMKCTYLLTSILNSQNLSINEEKNNSNENTSDADADLFSKIFINKFSNGFGKELNDIQQEEQLSIDKMNFLVKNLQDVKEIYNDEKKYWLLNAKN